MILGESKTNSEDPWQPPTEPVAVPITSDLDLHSYPPKDVQDVVSEYLRLCREKGLLRVRVVHGKGTGQMRRTVHAVLSRLSFVKSIEPAGAQEGHWGATIVFLHPMPPPPASES